MSVRHVDSEERSTDELLLSEPWRTGEPSDARTIGCPKVSVNTQSAISSGAPGGAPGLPPHELKVRGRRCWDLSRTSIPSGVVAGLFLITALSAQMIPTAAVAVLMSPIALSTAVTEGLSPQALMMAVAVARSCGFMSPVGHPVNLLVMNAVSELCSVKLPRRPSSWWKPNETAAPLRLPLTVPETIVGRMRGPPTSMSSTVPVTSPEEPSSRMRYH